MNLSRTARSGSATVEFALVLPFLVTMLLGIWEVGRLIEIQQILKNAVREGGRQASTGARTASDVQQTVQTYLKQAGVNTTGVTVTLTNLTASSRDPASANQLDHFQVVVTLPFDNVRWVFLTHITDTQTLTATSDWFSMKDAPVNVAMDIPVN